MEIDSITLGSLMRKRRKEMGLTLSDLADESVSVPTISNIERGITHNLSSDKVAYIREKLGLTDDVLMQMQQKTEVEEQQFKRKLSIIRNLLEVKQFDEARRRISDLEKEERLAEFPQLAVDVQLQKGSVLWRQGHYDRAKNALQQVFRLHKETGVDTNANLEAEAYFNLSLTVFYGDQDYEKAIEYADLGLEAIRKEDSQLKGRLLYQKANCYYHFERDTEAYRYAMESRALCEQTHDIKIFLLTYNMEGLVLSNQRLYKQAIKVFEQALDRATLYYNEPRLVSVLYLNMGDSYYRKKEYDKALEYYDIAFDLIRHSPEHTLVVVYYSYGEVYYELEEYDKAIEYVNKASALAEKLRISSEYLPLLILKAKIAMGKNESEVERVCQEGIKLAKKSKLYNKMKEFHFVLANYFERAGNREAFRQEAENMYHIEALLQRRE
ncbi:helix-turn-helix domain-containing protein [Numidum massiliense]|uniref:helix-turn-helix domain-containing protein n=1 Tax=Numidum massiliense TaxID=1522315 RepID=UPI0006D5485A|nr:helix-turn-helix domain-containing protein [Numidum massiliense]